MENGKWHLIIKHTCHEHFYSFPFFYENFTWLFLSRDFFKIDGQESSTKIYKLFLYEQICQNYINSLQSYFGSLKWMLVNKRWVGLQAILFVAMSNSCLQIFSFSKLSNFTSVIEAKSVQVGPAREFFWHIFKPFKFRK